MISAFWEALLMPLGFITFLSHTEGLVGTKEVCKESSGIEIVGVFDEVFYSRDPYLRSQRGGRGFESLHLHQENLLKSGCCVIRPHPDFFVVGRILTFVTFLLPFYLWLALATRICVVPFSKVIFRITNLRNRKTLNSSDKTHLRAGRLRNIFIRR